MAGEMSKDDLNEGGDWYGIRKEMEEIGRKAGAVVKVEPFDQYQGPEGRIYFGATFVGSLWMDYKDTGEVQWSFTPETNLKLKHMLKPTKGSENGMVSYLKKLKATVPNFKPFEVVPGQRPSHYTTPPRKKAQHKSLLHLVKSKYTIVIAGDIIDIKPKLQQKKTEDKDKKAADKEKNMQPLWDKAKLRVSESNAYAGGYELTVDVPTPADFLKVKGDWKDKFTDLLHPFINAQIDRWMGRPYIKKDDRAKQGFINVQAMWHFHDAFLAYSLGLDLSEWKSSAEVVDKNKIVSRQLLAEKAFKEMQSFRNVSLKKLKLQSQNEDERDQIWKEKFIPIWDKLAAKWKEKGISYVPLSQSKQGQKETAVGFINKIQSHYVIAKNSKVEEEVSKLMANAEFMRELPNFIDTANLGIISGHKRQKPEMVKFNALSLAFLEAIKAKDVGAANNAGEALVKAGHGAAFGL